MNSRGGVFVAANSGSAEWANADTGPTVGVCGSGNSVACGRFSFTFGLKGPCTALDAGQAGSLLALSEASTSLTHRGQWIPGPFGLVSTYAWQLGIHRWIQFSCTGICAASTPMGGGRCSTFDASASGM